MLNSKKQKIYGAYSLIINNELCGNGYIKYRLEGDKLFLSTELIAHYPITQIIGMQILDYNQSKNFIEIEVPSEDELIEIEQLEKVLAAVAFIPKYGNNIGFKSRRNVYDFKLQDGGLNLEFNLIDELFPFHLKEEYFVPYKQIQTKDANQFIRFCANATDAEIAIDLRSRF